MWRRHARTSCRSSTRRQHVETFCRSSTRADREESREEKSCRDITQKGHVEASCKSITRKPSCRKTCSSSTLSLTIRQNVCSWTSRNFSNHVDIGVLHHVFIWLHFGTGSHMVAAGWHFFIQCGWLSRPGARAGLSTLYDACVGCLHNHLLKWE